MESLGAKATKVKKVNVAFLAIQKMEYLDRLALQVKKGIKDMPVEQDRMVFRD